MFGSKNKNSMQSFKLLVLFGWISVFGCAQRNAPTFAKVEWMTLEQALEGMQREKRPILIDLYTDWCGWCKVMDKKTYTNKNVSAYLQEKFYAVKLNAESTKNITWNGKIYRFNANYKTHDFAVYLTGGQLSYPTTVIIPVQDAQPQAIPGFLEPKDLELIVKYFGEGKFGNVPFTQYQQQFKPSW
jgi:thioredoxin-related protein